MRAGWLLTLLAACASGAERAGPDAGPALASCETGAECDDGKSCTTDVCVAGVCEDRGFEMQCLPCCLQPVFDVLQVIRLQAVMAAANMDHKEVCFPEHCFGDALGEGFAALRCGGVGNENRHDLASLR